MSGGNWRAGPAVVVVVLFAAWVGLLAGQSRVNDLYGAFCLEAEQYGDTNAAREKDGQKPDGGGEESFFRPVLNSSAEQPPAECKTYEDIYNAPPAIWRFFSTADAWTAWGTIAGAALAGVAVYLLWGTLLATRETERLARKTLAQATLTNINTVELAQAQTRAYVGVKDARPDGPNAVEITIENAGQSPAFDVVIWAVFIKSFARLDEKNLMEWAKRDSDSAARILLPKQEWKDRVWHSVSVPYSGTFYHLSNFLGYFVGRIEYRDIFRRRQITFFRYRIESDRNGVSVCNLCDEGNYAKYDSFTHEGTIKHVVAKMLAELS